MSKSTPYKLTRFEETGSVKFNQVEDVEFWLTAINRIFLITPGNKTVFPALQGSVLRYDDPNFKATPAVVKALTKVLKKQREIRMNLWHSAEEDEVAWTYN